MLRNKKKSFHTLRKNDQVTYEEKEKFRNGSSAALEARRRICIDLQEEAPLPGSLYAADTITGQGE